MRRDFSSLAVQEVDFRGTLLPFLRALESPMAMACSRLLTLPPFPPRPLFAVPRLKRRISLCTSLLALGAYLRFVLFAIDCSSRTKKVTSEIWRFSYTSRNSAVTYVTVSTSIADRGCNFARA